jgi:hypothetical protein
MSKLDKFLEFPRRFDRWLKKAVGAENDLLYHFIRLLLIAIVAALVVAIVVEIVLTIWWAVMSIVSLIISVRYYLLAAAVLAAIVALVIYIRRKRSKRPEKVEEPAAATEQTAPQKPPQPFPNDEEARLRRAVLSADQPTRSGLQTVLTSLQRFDHRLELVITQVHYTDLFGDNWAVVRQFVESPQGKSVPELSAALLEIIILYKRAQEAKWVPINQDRIHAWWTEAARRRKLLSEIVDSSAAGPGSIEPKADIDAEPGPSLAAAKPGSPPTLDDLLNYYEQMKPAK